MPFVCMIFTDHLSLTGSLLVRYGPNQGSQLFGLWVFVAFAAGFPIALSMVASNVAGFTKKSVASAMMFMAYTVGNIIGPFLFFASEAPEYSVSPVTTTPVCITNMLIRAAFWQRPSALASQRLLCSPCASLSSARTSDATSSSRTALSSKMREIILRSLISLIGRTSTSAMSIKLPRSSYASFKLFHI